MCFRSAQEGGGFLATERRGRPGPMTVDDGRLATFPPSSVIPGTAPELSNPLRDQQPNMMFRLAKLVLLVVIPVSVIFPNVWLRYIAVIT